jgi:hypothetical protein
MDGLPQFRFKRTRGLLVWGLVMGLSWTTEPKDKRSSYASRRVGMAIRKTFRAPMQPHSVRLRTALGVLGLLRSGEAVVITGGRKRSAGRRWCGEVGCPSVVGGGWMALKEEEVRRRSNCDGHVAAVPNV